MHVRPVPPLRALCCCARHGVSQFCASRALQGTADFTQLELKGNISSSYNLTVRWLLPLLCCQSNCCGVPAFFVADAFAAEVEGTISCPPATASRRAGCCCSLLRAGLLVAGPAQIGTSIGRLSMMPCTHITAPQLHCLHPLHTPPSSPCTRLCPLQINFTRLGAETANPYLASNSLDPLLLPVTIAPCAPGTQPNQAGKGGLCSWLGPTLLFAVLAGACFAGYCAGWGLLCTLLDCASWGESGLLRTSLQAARSMQICWQQHCNWCFPLLAGNNCDECVPGSFNLGGGTCQPCPKGAHACMFCFTRQL